MAIEAEALRDAALFDAQSINDSDRVISVFAAPEWDELSIDGKEWVRAIIAETLSRHRSALAEDTARAAEGDVLATGWLTHMGREDGEERGPVVRFVLDASREHALKFAHIWNGATYEIRALPLDKEAADANR